MRDRVLDVHVHRRGGAAPNAGFALTLWIAVFNAFTNWLKGNSWFCCNYCARCLKYGGQWFVWTVFFRLARIEACSFTPRKLDVSATLTVRSEEHTSELQSRG